MTLDPLANLLLICELLVMVPYMCFGRQANTIGRIEVPRANGLICQFITRNKDT
jgi:hypothetical protein